MSRQVFEPGMRTAMQPRVRRGTSLIEVLIASVLLTTAIGALLGTSKKVSEQMATSRKQMVASSVAQARLDSLQSISCAALVSTSPGDRITRGIHEGWTVTSGTNSKLITLTLTIPGLSSDVIYTTIVPCV